MYGVGKTNIGKVRENNEDSILVSNEEYGALSSVYIVADGMGGHNAGETASSSAINYFCEYIEKNSYEDDDLLDFLISGTNYANKKVFEESKTSPELKGMGTTFSSCVIMNEKAYISHVGDSRVYKVDKKEILQITTDHTYVNEMIKSGRITKEQAKTHPNKNVVVRALGVSDDLLVDGMLIDIKEKDIILMCSDGLSNMIDDQLIKEIITGSDDFAKSVDELIATANKNGGEDNISVILIGKAGDGK